MKFIHLTDLHLVVPGQKLWGIDPLSRLETCLADITAYHGDAEFCVITGDLTEMGEEHAYAALKDRLKAFPLRTHLLIGNHDNRAVFRRVFGEGFCDENGFVQSSITAGGHRLLFLDTVKDAASSAGAYCVKRRKWLAEQLAVGREKPIVLFVHHPPFDIGHALMDLIKLEEPESFHAVLQGHNIRHIFFGHCHRPVSGTWRGIAFSSLSSLGHQVPLVGGSVSTVYSDEPPMYGVVLIEGDRTIVHMDAFLNRLPAQMSSDAERDNWY